MGNVYIEGKSADSAILLLAAAEELGLDPVFAVRTTTHGFNVPSEVADKAGFDEDGNRVEKKPAKKTAAKKAPAKKTTAKKTAAKKTTAPKGEE